MKTLIIRSIKSTKLVGIKHKSLYWCGSNYMPYQNSSWIMNSWIYGEGKTQIPLSSATTIWSYDTRSKTVRIYSDITIANNTKFNHIMVSFTDHYNAISIDRLLSKTKIGKDSRYFNNSLLCKPEVSSHTRLFFFY